MLDFGWSEMAVILLVALIVIGPKDLPKVARALGKWSAKARSMAREFQRSLDDMAREAELHDIKAEIEKASRTDFKRTIEKAVDPEGELTRAMDVRTALPRNPLSPGQPSESPEPPRIGQPARSEQPVAAGPAAPAAAVPPPASPPVEPAGAEKS